MRIEVTEKMRKDAQKGKTVLKQSRVHAGVGKGAIGAGITFLVFALFSSLPFLFQRMLGGVLIFALLGIPGLVFVVIGVIAKKKRAKDYLEFYGRETGYDEATILRAEQELLMPQTVMVCNAGNRRKENACCYITENFLVSITPEAGYLRRLSDMRAAFYSEKIPGIDSRIAGMVLISSQDIAREAQINSLTYRQCGGYVNALLNKESCAEVVGEIVKRNPSVIANPVFSDGKKMHDLLSMDNWVEDWKAIEQALQGGEGRNNAPQY